MDYEKVAASLDEVTRHVKGELKLKQVAVDVPVVNVKALRERLNMSQEDFARAYRLSTDTVRGWEQGRREPEGPARTLLALIQRNPEGIREQIQSFPNERHAL